MDKNLIKKYILIIISNLVLYLLSRYYLNFTDYKYLIMLVLVVIVDLFIYYYKEKIQFNLYLDFLTNLMISLILIIFNKNVLEYCSVVFSIVFANNIIFMRSRFSDKLFKRSIQYLMILIYSLITLFLSICLFTLIHKIM